MQESSRRIIQIIRSIPEGQVLSYGEVARRAGLVNGARRVSHILHTSTEKHDLPWHRVVNSQGSISLTGEGYYLQKRLLANEGVEFDRSGRIDLTRYSA
jgi:methylated-DNA-protein-cysteine methyltransferase-like protein